MPVPQGALQLDRVSYALPDQAALLIKGAFRQRLVPTLHGHVTFVAADVTTDQQTRASHYRAQIRIDPDQRARLPGVALAPGMPVEAHVMLGQRSFWQYLAQPVRDSFARAFREN